MLSVSHDEVEARWYHHISGTKAVGCELCPHNCCIAEGNTGKCGIRFNNNGKLIASGYGYFSALSLDPIEKKPLARYLPGSMILSVGSVGCNLRCQFCQNWTISQTQLKATSSVPVLPVHNELQVQLTYIPTERLIELAEESRSMGNIGLAFTYNEPIISLEYIIDCAREIKDRSKNDLKLILVTNGYINRAPLADLLPYVDALNIDLKAFHDSFYKQICGGALEPVKEMIQQCQNYRKERKIPHFEITTLIIPGLNDSPPEIEALSLWLAAIDPDIPLHLNRHHPDWKMLDRPPISSAALFLLADLARHHLHYVYTGNI